MATKKKQPQPPDHPLPPKSPEIEPGEIPEEIVPEEDPEIIPFDDPFEETPPDEPPAPGEGP